MTNSYYNRTFDVMPGNRVGSQAHEDQYELVEAGFDAVEAAHLAFLKIPASPVPGDQLINQTAAARANKVVAFDASGNATAIALTSVNDTDGTSASTKTPSVSSMTWVFVETDRVIPVGMRMRVASRAAPTTNFALGTVTAWNSGSETVTISVDAIGTVPASASDWNLMQEGARGSSGLTETTFVDKGTVAAGTCTFTIGTSDRYQRVQASGNITLAVSGWPASGTLGELLLECVNFGGRTITWPTASWVKYDGSFGVNFAASGITMQTAGTDFVLLWTRDGGTTVYAKVMR